MGNFSRLSYSCEDHLSCDPTTCARAHMRSTKLQSARPIRMRSMMRITKNGIRDEIRLRGLKPRSFRRSVIFANIRNVAAVSSAELLIRKRNPLFSMYERRDAALAFLPGSVCSIPIGTKRAVCRRVARAKNPSCPSCFPISGNQTEKIRGFASSLTNHY